MRSGETHSGIQPSPSVAARRSPRPSGRRPRAAGPLAARAGLDQMPSKEKKRPAKDRRRRRTAHAARASPRSFSRPALVWGRRRPRSPAPLRRRCRRRGSCCRRRRNPGTKTPGDDAGRRRGRITTPAPIAIRSVTAGEVASATTSSSIGLWNETWSPAQIESKPRSLPAAQARGSARSPVHRPTCGPLPWMPNATPVELINGHGIPPRPLVVRPQESEVLLHQLPGTPGSPADSMDAAIFAVVVVDRAVEALPERRAREMRAERREDGLRGDVEQRVAAASMIVVWNSAFWTNS